MALVKVYEWDFYSIQGSRYKIELHQDGGTPLASGLDLGSDGFVISSCADEDDRFSPVIGTSVEIPILVCDATSEAFINQIIVNQENSSFVKIYVWSGSVWNMFYRGVVLQDLIRNEDKYYPYQTSISASDGFGRLKNIDYNIAGVAYTGKSSLLTFLTNILTKIGLSNLYGATDTFISSGIDIYETNAEAGDLLVKTQLLNAAFYTTDSNGTEFMSCYDVLEQILRRFGLRIVQISGVFHIVSISRYKSVVNSTFHNYSKSAAILGTSSNKLILEQIQWKKMAESVYNRYPALHHTLIKYKYRQSQYPDSFIQSSGNYSLTQYEYIEGGAGESLGIRSSVVINYNSGTGSSPSVFRVKFRVTCYVGSYWLQGANGIMQWVSSANQYYYFYSGAIYASYGSVTIADLDIITPNLIDEGYLNFALDVVGIEDMNGNAFTPPTGYSISYSKEAKVYYVGISNESAEGVKKTYAYNMSAGINVDSSSNYEPDELIIGDAVYIHDVGRIEIFNGSQWVNASEWDVGTSYSGLTIDKVLANEILSGQKTPRVKFDLNAFLFDNRTFSDYCNPAAMALYNNTDVYVPLSVSFIAGTDEIQGNFFEIISIVTDITNSEAIISEGRDFNASTQVEISNIQNSLQKFGNISKIASLSSTVTGTITSLPIASMPDAIISKGDILTLFNPITGLSETVTASANIETAATSISINSATLTNSYGLGSVILYAGEKVIRKAANPRLSEQILTTDGAVGNYDVTILNGGGGKVTATLPRAADSKQRIYTIRCKDATFLTEIASVDLINGLSSIEIFKDEVIRVYSDGTNWFIHSALRYRNSVNFDTAYSYQNAIEKGELRWNASDGTLDIGMGYDGVVQQVGMEIYYRVKNQTGNRITDGQAIMYDGALGASGIIKGKPTDSTLADFPQAILGVATMDINNGDDGYVTHFGIVRGFNTSSYADGDILYWNPAVDGGLTKTAPTSPTPRIVIAAVVKGGLSNGTILVRPNSGAYLHEIHDVERYDPQTLTANSAPLWDDNDLVFKMQELNISNWDTAYNKSISSASFSTTTGEITLTLADSSTITVDIDGRFIPTSEKGAANGVATLDSSGKLPASQLPTSVLTYMGTWNASTNTPTLADGTGTAGNFYIVSIGGTQNLGSGNITFSAGDWVVYNGTIWEKTSNTSAVTSVNGYTGTVVLTTSDIAEGTNLYYTEARVSSNTDVSANTAARHTHSNKTTLDGISAADIGQWDDAYSWGDHAGLYDLLGAASTAVSTHESTYNHSNYNTAYSWGNHATVGYLTTETDPVFLASAAGGIAAGDITNWNAAYNNSIASAAFNTSDGVLTLTQTDSGTVTVDLDGRYLTSFTETDPVFSASVAGGIDSTDISNWDTSYNDSITAVSFTSGTLKLTQRDTTHLSVSLDGRYYLATNPSGYTSNVGTVTSVALSVPTGLTVTGTPITTSGTLDVKFATGYSIPTTANQTNWTAAYNDKINSASFNASNGVITLTQQDGGTVTVDIDGRYLTSYTETDPIYTASSWYSTTNNSANWNTAYDKYVTSILFNTGTGVLGLLRQDGTSITKNLDGRYLTSFTETDPIYTASSWYSTTNNSTNWNTAYSWGNHSGLYDLLGAASSAVSGHTSTYNHSNYDTAYGWGNWATGVNKTFIDALNVDADTLDGNDSTYFYPASNPNGYTANLGTVTSIALTVPTGLSISGTPITSSGTLAVTFTTGYSIPTDTNQSNWATAYSWGNHASAGYLTTETDPVFTASDAYGIDSTDISNWDTAYGWGDHATAGYLTAETDPIYTASSWYTTTNNSTDWDTAYSWGNHASAGYLTSETDPIFSASDAASITSTDISNWDTAFGWGNHSGLYDLLGAASGAISSHTSTYNHANYDTAYGWGDHATAGYLTAETDPIYTASSWYTTTNNATNWDTSYSWGDHAGLYDLIGAASSAVGTHESTYNHGNYNTAYSWGNHASAGYLTSETDPVFTASAAYSITNTDITNLGNLSGTNSGDQDLSGLQPIDSMLTSISALNDPNADRILFWDDSAGAITFLTIGSGLTLSDTTLSAGIEVKTHTFLCDVSRSEDADVQLANYYTLHIPYDFEITNLIASVTERPTGAAIKVDVIVNGSSILNSQVQIDDGGYTSAVSGTPYDASVTALTANDTIVIDVTQIGASTRGKGLKFYICGYQL